MHSVKYRPRRESLGASPHQPLHGTPGYAAGGHAPRSSYAGRGRYGRLFPSLPPLDGDAEGLAAAFREMGRAGGLMDASVGGTESPENSAVPAGFTFLGQFIDHDITFDPTSSLERQSDPEAIANFRTPWLELDSVYGSGPSASPQLYDRSDPGKLLTDDGNAHDVPRNSQGTALIGDPRNDENVIVSQLHLAFIKAHNAAIDMLRDDDSVPSHRHFETAQRLLRWHYQWIVVHEFLPLVCGAHVVEDVLDRGRCLFHWRGEPFIPVEFSVAAFRFGHTMVRGGYKINTVTAAPIFAADPRSSGGGRGGRDDFADLTGGRRLPATRAVDWRNFFVIDRSKPQPSMAMDTKLSAPLLRLPFAPEGVDSPLASLATRNLLRGLSFALPSGQAVATAMLGEARFRRHKLSHFECLGAEDLGDLRRIAPSLRLERETPLWFYVLREAQLQTGGKHLGSVGGRIVAEVILGLLEGDRHSYLRMDPRWEPTFLDKGRAFHFADLLRFAGVA